MPQTQGLIAGRFFQGSPYDRQGFISFSPVHFADAKALEERLDRLANKANKKTNKRDKPRDRSQANRGFTNAGEENEVSFSGRLRAMFEYHR